MIRRGTPPNVIDGGVNLAAENPYFEAVAGGVTVGTARESYADRAIDVSRERDRLVEEFAWAIPNEAAIATLAEHAPLLEVGAGRGYWARCVRDYCGDPGAVLATDADSSRDRVWARSLIECDAVDAIQRYGDGRGLFLCWPPLYDSMAADALDAYDGDTLVYVGEGRGGCTADEEFHWRLHDEWSLAETVAIPTYLGIRDRVEFWRRK